MAWTILYPGGYPIDGKIVPSGYGKPDSAPKPNFGIGSRANAPRSHSVEASQVEGAG